MTAPFNVKIIPPPKEPTRVLKTELFTYYFNEFEGEEYCYAMIRNWFDKDFGEKSDTSNILVA